MTPEQIEADIRAFVVRYEATPATQFIDGPAASLFLAWYQSRHLLKIIDALRTTLAHTPTRQMPALELRATLPAAPTIPAPPARTDLPWSDPANRA